MSRPARKVLRASGKLKIHGVYQWLGRTCVLMNEMRTIHRFVVRDIMQLRFQSLSSFWSYTRDAILPVDIFLHLSLTLTDIQPVHWYYYQDDL